MFSVLIYLRHPQVKLMFQSVGNKESCREREALAELQQDLVGLSACKASDAAISMCEEKLCAIQRECAAQAEHCCLAEEAAEAAANQLKVCSTSRHTWSYFDWAELQLKYVGLVVMICPPSRMLRSRTHTI